MTESRDESLKKELRDFYSTSQTYMERLKRHDEASFAEYITACMKMIPEHSTVLDCGCGTGLSSHLLQQAGFEVTGTDISPMFIAEARRRYGGEKEVSYAVEDVCEMSFPDASFDAVCSFDLIEHVFDVPKALEEMCRVASKAVIIFQANRLDFINHLEKAMHWEEKATYKPWEARTRPACLYRFVKYGLVTTAKAVGLNHKVYYVNPVLSNDEDACGHDFDATWLTNRYDIEKVLRENDCVVVERRFIEFEDGITRRIHRLGYNGKLLSYYRKLRAHCIICSKKK
jgi:ubiquinone/menaquinone biosynthesis C-methylase UbiE